jgi:hypothetical protein
MSNNFELAFGFLVHNGIFDDTIQLMLGWWNPKGVWVAQKNISPHKVIKVIFNYFYFYFYLKFDIKFFPKKEKI